MQHVLDAIFSISKMGKLQSKALIFGALLLAFPFALSSEVKLKGVSMEPGFPGDWTVARIRLQNSKEDSKVIDLKATLGSLENSVFEQRSKVEVLGNSSRMIWMPIWIPKDILEGSASKNKGQARSKQRQFVTLLVQLFDNGALKHRETALGTLDATGLMKGMQYGRNRDKNATYDPSSELNPREAAVLPEALGNGKKRRVFKMRADEMNGYSYLHDALLERKSVIWVKKGFDQVYGLWPLMEWVERGGLLIVDPMPNEDLGNLSSLLGVQTGDPVWNTLKKTDWKLKGDLSLEGREVFADDNWSTVFGERGVSLASSRDWGMGKVVQLNYRWDALIGKDRERAKAIADALSPKTLGNELSQSEWPAKRKLDLVMRHGNRIWARETVMMYLGSLILFSMILWFVPFFRRKPELRWGVWSLGMVVWTGAGLGVFMNKASTGNKVFE